MQALESASLTSCMTPATFIDSICPKQSTSKKQKPRNEVELPTNRIVLPWPTYTDPRLNEVDLEPSPKRGGDKINMEKQGTKTQKKASRILQPELTYGSQHLER